MCIRTIDQPDRQGTPDVNRKLNNIDSLIKTIKYNKLLGVWETLIFTNSSAPTDIQSTSSKCKYQLVFSWFQPRGVWGIQPLGFAKPSLHETIFLLLQFTLSSVPAQINQKQSVHCQTHQPLLFSTNLLNCPCAHLLQLLKPIITSAQSTAASQLKSSDYCNHHTHPKICPAAQTICSSKYLPFTTNQQILRMCLVIQNVFSRNLNTFVGLPSHTVKIPLKSSIKVLWLKDSDQPTQIHA